MGRDWKTTLSGVVSAVGSGLVAAGYFYPPLMLAGGVLSALGKVLLGASVPDKATVVRKTGS